uniref:RNA-directed DNA polymerase n=1 Tax=Trichuris muris TaxID=70415 RepID=A0A5S6Q662_TRIMR
MVTAKCYVPQHVSCDLLGVELIEKLGIYDTPINATYGITRSQGTTKTNGLSTKTKVSSLFTERRLPSYPALVFAVKKFHRFVLGRRFTLLTDHQPLLAIFGTKKGIPLYTANRLQRWATTLLGYDFALEYRSTTSFGNADALSRLIATQLRQEEDIVIASVDGEIQRVLVDAVRNLPVTSRMIRDETARDPMLQKVLQCLSKGWPKVRAPLLQHFYNRRQSLSVVDGCLLFADRVVVPNCLQGQVTSQLHSEHPGIVRMKALARSVVYWPGLDQQIENIVRQCSACAMVAKLPAKTPPCSWPPADKCWSRVHVDYAGPVEGRYLLVLVDAFSKWPEVFITEKITSSATISLLSRVFAQFGAPETIVSDNGTQFTAAEFKIFCAKKWHPTHLDSPRTSAVQWTSGTLRGHLEERSSENERRRAHYETGAKILVSLQIIAKRVFRIFQVSGRGIPRSTLAHSYQPNPSSQRDPAI